MAKTEQKMVKFQTPITAFYNGDYVQPGTEIELEESEANSITKAHGLWNGPGPALMNDPGNTQATRVDAASIAALNEMSKINGGTGKEFVPVGEDDEGEEDELDTMSKDNLIAYADLHKIKLASGDNKDEIKAKIKAAGK